MWKNFNKKFEKIEKLSQISLILEKKRFCLFLHHTKQDQKSKEKETMNKVSSQQMPLQQGASKTMECKRKF